jgi:hypothetical protein
MAVVSYPFALHKTPHLIPRYPQRPTHLTSLCGEFVQKSALVAVPIEGSHDLCPCLKYLKTAPTNQSVHSEFLPRGLLAFEKMDTSLKTE